MVVQDLDVMIDVESKTFKTPEATVELAQIEKRKDE